MGGNDSRKSFRLFSNYDTICDIKYKKFDKNVLHIESRDIMLLIQI